MYQFFVEPEQIDVAAKSVIIRGTDVNHIKNVLRMRPGEEVAVSNGIDGKEYRCGILALEEDCVRLELRFIKEDGVELPAKIYLFQGLPKADKMELIIQKAVELGAFQVIPVSMKRCVVKLDEKKADAKIKRWQGIAEAAAKQSKRGVIPTVAPVMSYVYTCIANTGRLLFSSGTRHAFRRWLGAPALAALLAAGAGAFLKGLLADGLRSELPMQLAALGSGGCMTAAAFLLAAWPLGLGEEVKAIRTKSRQPAAGRTRAG